MGVAAIMGIVVEYDGNELWSPSLRVGNLFVDQIRSLESIVGEKSGIEFSMADTLEVDGPVFNEFIKRALDMLDTTNNGPLFVMSSGCLQVAIALDARITGQWPAVSAKLERLVTNARTVMDSIG